jgi:hypothetical protein
VAEECPRGAQGRGAGCRCRDGGHRPGVRALRADRPVHRPAAANRGAVGRRAHPEVPEAAEDLGRVPRVPVAARRSWCRDRVRRLRGCHGAVARRLREQDGCGGPLHPARPGRPGYDVAEAGRRQQAALGGLVPRPRVLRCRPPKDVRPQPDAWAPQLAGWNSAACSTSASPGGRGRARGTSGRSRSAPSRPS